MQLTFEFPADTSALAKIGEVIADAARSIGFSDEKTSDIQLCVDEACTNTIIHGLKEDPLRYFTLEIKPMRDSLEIIIKEIGEPFDPGEVPEADVDAALEDRQIGGLGMYFVKELMDEVDYQVLDDGLKILRMVKNLEPGT